MNGVRAAGQSATEELTARSPPSNPSQAPSAACNSQFYITLKGRRLNTHLRKVKQMQPKQGLLRGTPPRLPVPATLNSRVKPPSGVLHHTKRRLLKTHSGEMQPMQGLLQGTNPGTVIV